MRILTAHFQRDKKLKKFVLDKKITRNLVKSQLVALVYRELPLLYSLYTNNKEPTEYPSIPLPFFFILLK